MKIQEYKYKVQVINLRTNAVDDYSLEDFINTFEYWNRDSLIDCEVNIINREKPKPIYTERFRAGDSPPTYIIEALMQGDSEESVIPKKTIANIGEMLGAKYDSIVDALKVKLH